MTKKTDGEGASNGKRALLGVMDKLSPRMACIVGMLLMALVLQGGPTAWTAIGPLLGFPIQAQAQGQDCSTAQEVTNLALQVRTLAEQLSKTNERLASLEGQLRGVALGRRLRPPMVESSP